MVSSSRLPGPAEVTGVEVLARRRDTALRRVTTESNRQVEQFAAAAGVPPAGAPSRRPRPRTAVSPSHPPTAARAVLARSSGCIDDQRPGADASRRRRGGPPSA